MVRHGALLSVTASGEETANHHRDAISLDLALPATWCGIVELRGYGDVLCGLDRLSSGVHGGALASAFAGAVSTNGPMGPSI